MVETKFFGYNLKSKNNMQFLFSQFFEMSENTYIEYIFSLKSQF